MAYVSPVGATTWDHSEHIDRFVGYGLLSDGSAVVRPLAILGLFSQTYWIDQGDAVKYAASLNQRRHGLERWAHIGMFALALLMLWFYLPAELALTASVALSFGAILHVRHLVQTWFFQSFESAQPMTDPHLWQRLEMASVTSPYLVLPRVLWLVALSLTVSYVGLLVLASWSVLAAAAVAFLMVPFTGYHLWLLLLHGLFRARNGRAPRPDDAATYHRQLGYIDLPYAEVV